MWKKYLRNQRRWKSKGHYCTRNTGLVLLSTCLYKYFNPKWLFPALLTGSLKETRRRLTPTCTCPSASVPGTASGCDLLRWPWSWRLWRSCRGSTSLCVRRHRWADGMVPGNRMTFVHSFAHTDLLLLFTGSSRAWPQWSTGSQRPHQAQTQSSDSFRRL